MKCFLIKNVFLDILLAGLVEEEPFLLMHIFSEYVSNS